MLRLRVPNFLSILFTAVFFSVPLAALAIKLPDPINAESSLEIWARVLKVFLASIGIFGLLNFIVAGVGLIASQGNPEKVKKNRDIMLWTLIGIGLLFGAYAILAFFFDRLSGSLNIGTP